MWKKGAFVEFKLPFHGNRPLRRCINELNKSSNRLSTEMSEIVGNTKLILPAASAILEPWKIQISYKHPFPE